MVQWIEIAADYRCNNRCVGCFAVSDSGPEMSRQEIFRQLRSSRQQGATGFWFGGGEPTMRSDFLKIVRAAKKLGFARIKVQTNGMMCATADNLERMLNAGVTEFNLSIKGHTSELHDELTQTPGCFDLLCAAAELLVARNVPVEGDILMYRENTPLLPEILKHFMDLGIQHFNLWHLSLFGADKDQEEALADRVPRMTDVARSIHEALAHQWPNEAPSITALHLPPCALPQSQWSMLFRASELGLLVADPGGHSFPLEQSPFEGGVYLPGCDECAARTICDGLRDDYLSVFGDEEFQPIKGPPVHKIPSRSGS